MTARRIIIIGPAYPLRGGLASFNERLARQFTSEGNYVSIYTFSLQYPGFLFPGTTQYSTEPPPKHIDIKVSINSINPFNWLKVGNELKRLKPDIVVVRYWLPFLGPCLGTILRIVKSNRQSKIICIADNIKPHEKRPGDVPFTRYFIPPVDGFVTMSDKVMKDLTSLTNKPAQKVVHPLYDNFGEQLSKQDARKYLGLPSDEKIILFFGFIRQYKGLDLLLKALALPSLKQAGIKLLIAGEFYEDRKAYDLLIADNNLLPQLILKTDFIPDSEVKYYLSAADFVIQPYKNATQSGVTPLAYHFEKPMLVTNVGGLPDLVPAGKVGVVAEPTPISIAANILKLYELGENYFLPHLREEKKKYSWHNLTSHIVRLSSL